MNSICVFATISVVEIVVKEAPNTLCIYLQNVVKCASEFFVFCFLVFSFSSYLHLPRLKKIREKECIINWLQASGQQCLL